MSKLKVIKKNNCYKCQKVNINELPDVPPIFINQWIQTEDKEQLFLDNKNNINIATYNILFGAPKTSFNFILRNNTRFNYITQTLIPDTNNEILGFCEVNENFWENLKQSEYAQENLYLSQSQILYQDKSHEVTLASKFPFKSYFLSDLSKNHMGRYLFTVFPCQQIEFSFIVIQAHTFAYEERFNVRLQQMQDIDEFLQQLKQNPEYLESKKNSIYYDAIVNAIKTNSIILQGDLNLHAPFETQFIYKTNFIDTWLESHSLNDGFTWDSKQNSLIKLILPFDNRRMRLDRICLRNNNTVFQVEDCKVLAQEVIQPFLCGSDHYMLQCTLSFNQLHRQYKQKFNYELKKTLPELSDKDTKYRSISTIIKLRIGTLLLVLFLIFALIFI